MKLIKTVDAVGTVLCHDMTQIIPGQIKDAVFRKGHIVTEADIPVLLSIGKDHLYIWENDDSKLHENEAAQFLYDLCKNKYMDPTDVKEGKIDLIANTDGVLKINIDKLNRINEMGEMMIATRHNNFPVKKGDKIAGTRIIPLVIEKEKLELAKKTAGEESIMTILPYKKKRVGIVTTGNEVFYGRIKDAFGPAIRRKLEEFDTEILGQKIVSDSKKDVTEAIMSFINDGVDMVICTGGMSVDPDDMTPAAIASTGAEIISYGAPVLPGAMFLLAYYNNQIPILGLPGCVMYSRRTIFDLVLPRIMADEKLTSKDLAVLGQGGLCLCCDICTFPNCAFGK